VSQAQLVRRYPDELQSISQSLSLSRTLYLTLKKSLTATEQQQWRHLYLCTYECVHKMYFTHSRVACTDNQWTMITIMNCAQIERAPNMNIYLMDGLVKPIRLNAYRALLRYVACHSLLFFLQLYSRWCAQAWDATKWFFASWVK
jgi:hypothetical protein